MILCCPILRIFLLVLGPLYFSYELPYKKFFNLLLLNFTTGINYYTVGYTLGVNVDSFLEFEKIYIVGFVNYLLSNSSGTCSWTIFSVVEQMHGHFIRGGTQDFAELTLLNSK